MTLSVIQTTKAPKAIGPYSQAKSDGTFLFVSGQLPLDPKTGAFPSQEVGAQTKQSLMNLKAILEEAGLGLEDVMRCDIFLKNMDDFQKVNEMYGKFFSVGAPPARQTVEVARLPMDALVEISCIARVK